MRKLVSLMIGSFLVAGAAAQAAPKEDPQVRLERALEGRVAGEPVDCISMHNVKSSKIIDGTAILYETIGGTVYVNRPTNGAESLRRNDSLVTDTRSSRLCSIDVVRLYDSSARFQTGVVFLGDFVPYRRVRSAAAN